MEKEELEKLYKDFTLQLVLSKNLDDIGLIAITKKQLKQIIKIINHYNQIQSQLKKQKEVIDDCKEDISNLLDIINKNCYELKCTSDEWLVIQKYQDKEV